MLWYISYNTIFQQNYIKNFVDKGWLFTLWNRLCPTATSATMADQALFDQWGTNFKNNHPKGNIWQSIADHLGYLGTCCSIFSDEELTSVEVSWTVPQTS